MLCHYINLLASNYMNKFKWNMIKAEASRHTVLVLCVVCVCVGRGGVLVMTECTNKMCG